MFVDRYIQLQLVRFADRLDVQVRVDPAVTGAAVPTFVLQPLVENAIRHGVSHSPRPGSSSWRRGRAESACACASGTTARACRPHGRSTGTPAWD